MNGHPKWILYTKSGSWAGVEEEGYRIIEPANMEIMEAAPIEYV